jgi:hypothetical protein
MGTKVSIGINTPNDGTVAINGVRVGFENGGGELGLRKEPANVFDSRTDGGKFTAGEIRTITLPASLIAPGTVGILANVQTINAAGNGFLRIFPEGATPPSRTLYYGTAPVAGSVTIAMRTHRKIQVFASVPVHVLIDVAATIG